MTPRAQTFDSFGTGRSNRFAHAAALAAAESPGKAYNPLFIWGGPGLGKTHLLRSIGRYSKALYPSLDIEYVSGAALCRDLVTSKRSARGKDDVKHRYGSVDLLLIDDVDRLVGSHAAQAGLMEHVIEPLCRDGRQVVLTSDRPPTNFRGLRDLHLVTEWGLVVDIAAPDAETLSAILRQRTDADIPDDAVHHLVCRNHGSVQALLEDYAVVYDYATTVGKPVTIELAQRALVDA
jgi:chromosomal replication initiator protein